MGEGLALREFGTPGWEVRLAQQVEEGRSPSWLNTAVFCKEHEARPPSENRRAPFEMKPRSA